MPRFAIPFTDISPTRSPRLRASMQGSVHPPGPPCALCPEASLFTLTLRKAKPLHLCLDHFKVLCRTTNSANRRLHSCTWGPGDPVSLPDLLTLISDIDSGWTKHLLLWDHTKGAQVSTYFLRNLPLGSALNYIREGRYSYRKPTLGPAFQPGQCAGTDSRRPRTRRTR